MTRAATPPEADLYGLLGVHPGASTEQIRAAHRREAKRFHPDVSGNVGTTKRMAALNDAKDWLLDSSRRAEYDASRVRSWAEVDRRASPPRRPAPAPPPPPPRPRARRRSPPRPRVQSEFWTGLGKMPRTKRVVSQSPFPGRDACPICDLAKPRSRSDSDEALAFRSRPAAPSDHCALGHVAEFSPSYGRRTLGPILARQHLWGHPYENERQRASHQGRCPWAAGGGTKDHYLDGPNWELPEDYHIRKLAPDRELESFLYPAVSKGVIRKALDAAEAGCVVLAIEESNWIASIFAGRWAYNVRVERARDGRPARTFCDCSRDDPCTHAIATWIVWAAGAVVSRPPQPRPRASAADKAAARAAQRASRRQEEARVAELITRFMAEQKSRGLVRTGNGGFPWRPFPPQANEALAAVGFGFTRCDYGWFICTAPVGGRDLIRVKRGVDGGLAARAIWDRPEASLGSVARLPARVDAALVRLAAGSETASRDRGGLRLSLDSRVALFAAAMTAIRSDLGDSRSRP